MIIKDNQITKKKKNIKITVVQATLHTNLYNAVMYAPVRRID